MNGTESGSDFSGEGTPNPNTGNQNDKPNSTDVNAVAAAVIAQLDSLLDRKLQSIKDKRLGKVERQLDDLQKKLADTLVQKTGMAPEEAEEIASRLPTSAKAGVPVAGEPVAGTHTTLSDAEKSILQEGGLSETDPDVIALNSRKFSDPSARLVELAKVVARKNRPASAAGLQTPTAQGVGHDLKTEYEAELRKVAPGDTNAALALIKKYRKEGYDPTRPQRN